MANENKPITELPPGTAFGSTDLLVYVDMSGTPMTKKITEVNAAMSLAVSGYSGYSGRSGFSGFSGSGVSGYSGFSGVGAAGGSGYSGYSGIGTSGYSGFSGTAFATLIAVQGSDDTYTGMAMTGLNAGATIAQWETVYLDGSSTWQLADANGSSTYPARGLATAAYSNTNPATILMYGTVRNDAWAWTPGVTIYLSGTPGGLTQTPPATSGDKVQKVGFALNADNAFFDFNSTYLTVT